MRTVLAGLLVVGGCTRTPDPKTNEPTIVPVDSAEPDDTAPPDDSADTGDPLEPVALAGRVEWPEAGVHDAVLAVAASHVTFHADTVAFGSTLEGVAVNADGTFILDLPARPPTTELAALAPADHPHLRGALYMLTAFVPTSTGSLHFAEGRPIRGMAFHRMLVWFDPTTLGDSGWPGGWTLIDTGLAGSYNPPSCLVGTTQPLMWRWSDGYPHLHAIGEEDLVIGLRGVEVPLDIAGRRSGSLGVIDRLAGVPQQVASGESPSLEPVVDIDIRGDDFSATLDTAPPPSHDLTSDADWQVTLAYVLQYADDGDGRWTLDGDGDRTVLQSACFEGQPVYIRYTREVDTWRGIRLLDCQEGQVGWRLMTLTDAGDTYVALDDAASASLTVSSACRY